MYNTHTHTPRLVYDSVSVTVAVDCVAWQCKGTAAWRMLCDNFNFRGLLACCECWYLDGDRIGYLQLLHVRMELSDEQLKEFMRRHKRSPNKICFGWVAHPLVERNTKDLSEHFPAQLKKELAQMMCCTTTSVFKWPHAKRELETETSFGRIVTQHTVKEEECELEKEIKTFSVLSSNTCCFSNFHTHFSYSWLIGAAGCTCRLSLPHFNRCRHNFRVISIRITLTGLTVSGPRNMMI